MNSNIQSENIYQSINTSILFAISKFNSIQLERKLQLQKLSDYIQKKMNEQNKVNLIFICTHNSRRSHFAQIWAQTAAAYYNIPSINCYSGGTEVTAFNANAVKALQAAGFIITHILETSNPHYEVKYSDTAVSIDAFSKKYSDDSNPANSFAAIMTCSHADESCPNVVGAESRFNINYEDPKIADGRVDQTLVYNERSMQIATEMCYVFSLIN